MSSKRGWKANCKIPAGSHRLYTERNTRLSAQASGRRGNWTADMAEAADFGQQRGDDAGLQLDARQDRVSVPGCRATCVCTRCYLKRALFAPLVVYFARLQVNYLSHFLLTNGLMPALRGRPARVVHVTCQEGRTRQGFPRSRN